MNKIHLFLDQMINTNETQMVKEACPGGSVRGRSVEVQLCQGGLRKLCQRGSGIWVVLAASCTYQPGTPQVGHLLSQGGSC